MNDESNRVYHGGSWLNRPSSARVSYRGWDAPGLYLNNLGVRLVRQLSPLARLAELKETKDE